MFFLLLSGNGSVYGTEYNEATNLADLTFKPSLIHVGGS